MKTLLNWLKNYLSNRKGRLTALWLITCLLLIVSLFSGFGEPILPYILNEKTAELAKPKHNQSVYDHWYQGEKTIAKIQGREFQDPRDIKQRSLIDSWKWWIVFVIFFIISSVYTTIDITQKGGKKVKSFSRQLAGKIKEWLIKFRERRQAKLGSQARTKTNVRPIASRKKHKELPRVKIGDSFWRLFSIDMLGNFTERQLNKLLDKTAAALIKKLRR